MEDKRLANKNAIASRQSVFENMKPTCTKIINHLDILGLEEGIINQAKSLNRVIQGGQKKTTTPPDENGETGNTVSTSRQSYTQMAENFGILLQLLATIPTYNPNEDDLKLTNLTTYQASLVSATQSVDQTEAEFNLKLIERDNILYAGGTGLYSTAQNVKKICKKPLRSHFSRICKCLKNRIHEPKIIFHREVLLFFQCKVTFLRCSFIFLHNCFILAQCGIIFLRCKFILERCGLLF